MICTCNLLLRHKESNPVKKLLTLTALIVAVMALMAAPVAFACGGDKAETAKQASADKTACASKTDAKMISADNKAGCASGTSASLANSTACSAAEKAACGTSAKMADGSCDYAACAAAKGISVEECVAKCSEGKLTVHTVSIEGMTCGGCENSVRQALVSAPGVKSVLSVDHKSGTAKVVAATEGCCTATMTKMVADKGYKAQIIPAVARTTSSTDGACSAAKNASDKAGCSATCTGEKKTDGTNIKAEGTASSN